MAMASRLEEVAHAFADRLRRLEERVEELERKKSAPTDGEEMERKVTELEVAVDSVLAGRTTLEDKPERAVRLVDALRNGAEPARLPDYRRFVAAMADVRITFQGERSFVEDYVHSNSRLERMFSKFYFFSFSKIIF